MKKLDKISWHLAEESRRDAVSLFLVNGMESMTVRFMFDKKALTQLYKGILRELGNLK